MAGRSKKLEDNSRRFRTLLQSIDTARYHQDRPADRKTDIDQARTEILSAVLFGHEIVIPAGVVADCPAAYVLLPEVLEHFERARRRIYHDTGRRYFPFRLGVERRFVERDARGYNAFVADYIEGQKEQIEANRQSVTPFQKLAEDSKPEAVRQSIVRLGEAFLSRQWTELRAINPGYADYFELIHENFSENSDRTPRPVTARDGALTSVPQDYYHAAVRHCCNNLETRNIEYEHVAAVRRTTRVLRNHMTEAKVDAGQRGSWYGWAEEYENRWDDVRGWFDHALYHRMARAFGIDIPSYFCQEVATGELARDVSLAYLDGESLLRFKADLQAGQPALPPAASRVNWAAVWETVSESEVQDRIRILHLKLVDAREVLRAERRTLGSIATPERARRSSMLLRDYRRRSFAAIDAHIDFLNHGQSGLVFRQRNNRLMVDALRPRQRSKRGRTLITNMIGAGVGAAADMAIKMATSPEPSGLIVFPVAVAANYIASAIDQLAVQTVIDLVKRPGAELRQGVAAKADFYAAERTRVNYWLSSG